jgi:hypothetical protein
MVPCAQLVERLRALFEGRARPAADRADDEALEDGLCGSQARRHDLNRVLFEEVGSMLEEGGLLMRQGRIVDATIIAAPPSTNKQKSRDLSAAAPLLGEARGESARAAREGKRWPSLAGVRLLRGRPRALPPRSPRRGALLDAQLGPHHQSEKSR